MIIKESRTDATLILSLEGRLDTTTAPELEKVLEKNYPSVNELIFDFEKLDYMSSAGLRLMLKAQRAMEEHGGILIRHASNLVMSVFEVTGFKNILRFE
ncbi:MAG: STAS domain-containing protein [Clostridia bacterium]|jgi:anti-sigma B factor antagonist|nr:STAS domain-containing protein [Clostridia bacterium]